MAILDMGTYRINSLLIIRSILLLPPSSRQMRPSPHPASLGVRPPGGWEPPPSSPWALTSCPCIRPGSAWMLLPETHSSATHPLFPPRGPWPPDLTAPVWTDLLARTGSPSGGHTPHRVPEPAVSSTRSNRPRKSGRKTTKPANALLRELGKKRKNSWQWPSCLEAIVTLPSSLPRLLKTLISREMKCNQQQWSLSTSAVR